MTREACAEIAASAYLVVVAMLVGSFINLAVDRLPRGESVVRPRSHCRSCGRVLNLTDLIPVAGYIVRRGRCATCGVAIGFTSPAVEGACGAGMAVALLLFGVGWAVAAGVLVVAVVALTCVALAIRRKPSGR